MKNIILPIVILLSNLSQTFASGNDLKKEFKKKERFDVSMCRKEHLNDSEVMQIRSEHWKMLKSNERRFFKLSIPGGKKIYSGKPYYRLNYESKNNFTEILNAESAQNSSHLNKDGINGI